MYHFALLIFFCQLTVPLYADWPQWRGPNGDGTSAATQLPLTWSAEDNIAWKTTLPAWSGSTPVVAGKRVFVISPSEPEGAGEVNRRAGNVTGPGGDELLLYCLSLENGEILWQQPFDSGNALRMKHNATSPSPVIDDERVYVVSGNGRIAAFDLEGHPVWQFDLQEQYGKIGTAFGYAASPILHEGKLIFAVIHGQRTDDLSYLLALDATSGQVVWHVERPSDAKAESQDAYTTPALLTRADGDQIVIVGANYVTGHDAKTGQELWRGGGLNPKDARNFRIVPSPVVKEGMIFAGTRVQPFTAYRAGGSGDVTDSHIAWQYTERNAPDVPTPVSDGPHLFLVSDAGEVTCLDAKTGVKLGAADTKLGRVSASPLLAQDRLYIVGETGETVILSASPELEPLGKNALAGAYTLSSPAAVDGHLLIRSGAVLYCIGTSSGSD